MYEIGISSEQNEQKIEMVKAQRMRNRLCMHFQILNA